MATGDAEDLEGEKSFRKIQGVKDLWMLQTALGRREIKRVDAINKAA